MSELKIMLSKKFFIFSRMNMYNFLILVISFLSQIAWSKPNFCDDLNTLPLQSKKFSFKNMPSIVNNDKIKELIDIELKFLANEERNKCPLKTAVYLADLRETINFLLEKKF